MPDPAMTREDIYRQPATAAERGVIHKPLSAWERVYNVTAVRKVAILVVLAAAWEIYSRWLNNPLLFPTFGATVDAPKKPTDFWTSSLMSSVLSRGHLRSEFNESAQY